MQIFTRLCTLLANHFIRVSLVFFFDLSGSHRVSTVKAKNYWANYWRVDLLLSKQNPFRRKDWNPKKQHYQNLRDDMRGVVSGIISAPAWICREIDLEEGANWFLVLATCLDLIHSNKNRKIITKYTDHFYNNLGWSKFV